MKSSTRIDALLKEPGFKDIPFLSNDATRQARLYTPEAKAANNESIARGNAIRAQTRADETREISIYAGGGIPKFIFPTNIPNAKQKFLNELQEVYKPKQRGKIREKTLIDLAKEKNLNYNEFTVALKKFLKDEGLANDPRYNLNPITDPNAYKAAKEKVIADWLKNPNVSNFDKDLLRNIINYFQMTKKK
jgi:hypothetical protein